MNDLVAANVRAERARKGMTQHELASAALISRDTLRNVESGRGATPVILNAIALALGVDLSVIVPTQAAAEGGAA